MIAMISGNGITRVAPESFTILSNSKTMDTGLGFANLQKKFNYKNVDFPE